MFFICRDTEENKNREIGEYKCNFSPDAPYSISTENPLRVKAIKLGSGEIQMIPVASGKVPR